MAVIQVGHMTYITQKLLIIPGIIIGLTFHEFAHALAASLMGDNTAKNMGRCSVNPLKHIDWIGLICLFFVGFGWGKPVQVNPYNISGKNRKLKQVVISAAGVVANLIIAFIFAIIVTALAHYNSAYVYGSGIGTYVYYVLYYVMYINIVLMIFNLIPIPPLDGYNIVAELTSFDETPLYNKLLQYGSLILIVLLVFNVFDYILTPGINAVLSAFQTVLELVF